MRLILTEYINSLKEDGELDQLIQDILLAYGITIISKPERGRQHGVDIYAVGPDFEDGNTEKVFLVTVKQGDLDRRNWNMEQNSIYQSLNEIKDVFIRNNLLDQHKGLPVKIVVAFNGILKTAVQQDWRGYTENNRQHEYALWTEGWLLRHFEEKLLNEQAFSNEVRSLVRKSIIHLDAPGYDLADYARLLQLFQENFREAKHKKAKLKILRELHVVVAIVLKYCDQAENLLHGVRVVEKYLLALGELLFPGEEDKEFTLCFVAAHETMLETFLRYIEKLTPVAEIRDGFSRSVLDPVVYTDIVYRHVGIFAMAGLVIFQLHDIVEAKGDEKAELRARFLAKATAIAATLIHMVNHNMIFYSPRSDEQQIEICLLFILLYRLGMKKQIRDMLAQFHEQIADGYALLQIFPEYHNNKRTIAELQIDAERRKHYDYQASNLLTILTEWCVVLEDESSYQLFRQFKEKDIAGLDLMLWFPEQDTEAAIYSRFASNDTGYVLSNIVLPESMSDYEKLLLEEFAHNCAEKEFSFVKQSIWSLGLMASRHFRTYIFPYYWRQFLKSLPPEIVSE